jgi:hypothetical protein
MADRRFTVFRSLASSVLYPSCDFFGIAWR